MSNERINIEKIIQDLADNNPNVKELDLSNQALSTETILELATALTNNTHLTSLNISKNDLSFESVRALTEMLTANTRLEELNLSHCNLSDMEAMVFADSIEVNRSLRIFNLEHNHIHDMGAALLAEALWVNAKLKNLELAGNEVTKAGYKQLLEARIINHRRSREIDHRADASQQQISEAINTTTRLLKDLCAISAAYAVEKPAAEEVANEAPLPISAAFPSPSPRLFAPARAALPINKELAAAPVMRPDNKFFCTIL